MNVRELQSNKDNKRKDVFDWLKSKSCNIYCLQDTHSIPRGETRWSAEWGFQCIYSHKNSESGGVSILFNNNFVYKIKSTELAENEHYIIVEIITDENYITLVNLCGPNRDTPDFFLRLHSKLLYSDAPVRICGDWNVMQDYEHDTRNLKKTLQSISSTNN